jgi:hypothetical protein
MDVVTDVALFGQKRLPGVHSNPNVDQSGGERVGEMRGGAERTLRAGEGEEEGVSLGIDLGSALGGTGVPDHPAVLGERLSVRLGAELVEQSRRPLDVGEEKSDRSRGEIGSHAGIMC